MLLQFAGAEGASCYVEVEFTHTLKQDDGKLQVQFTAVLTRGEAKGGGGITYSKEEAQRLVEMFVKQGLVAPVLVEAVKPDGNVTMLPMRINVTGPAPRRKPKR